MAKPPPSRCRRGASQGAFPAVSLPLTVRLGTFRSLLDGFVAGGVSVAHVNGAAGPSAGQDFVAHDQVVVGDRTAHVSEAVSRSFRSLRRASSSSSSAGGGAFGVWRSRSAPAPCAGDAGVSGLGDGSPVSSCSVRASLVRVRRIVSARVLADPVWPSSCSHATHELPNPRRHRARRHVQSHRPVYPVDPDAWMTRKEGEGLAVLRDVREPFGMSRQ